MKIETTAVNSIGKTTELHYYTKEGVDITECVRSGKTELYDDQLEAMERAKQLKTYHYPVYKYKSISNQPEFMGYYAVPK